MLELADAFCKLLNDSNAKIQLSALENVHKIFPQISPFIENHVQLFYKAILANLGSSNIGVRKNSDQLLKLFTDELPDKLVLLQATANML